jgi:hypothetical protein
MMSYAIACLTQGPRNLLITMKFISKSYNLGIDIRMCRTPAACNVALERSVLFAKTYDYEVKRLAATSGARYRHAWRARCQLTAMDSRHTGSNAIGTHVAAAALAASNTWKVRYDATEQAPGANGQA